MIQAEGITITSSTVFLKNTGNQGHVVFMEYFVSISMTYADFCVLNQKLNLAIVRKMDALQLRQAIVTANLAQ